jgi:hypothetical protein
MIFLIGLKNNAMYQWSLLIYDNGLTIDKIPYKYNLIYDFIYLKIQRDNILKLSDIYNNRKLYKFTLSYSFKNNDDFMKNELLEGRCSLKDAFSSLTINKKNDYNYYYDKRFIEKLNKLLKFAFNNKISYNGNVDILKKISRYYKDKDKNGKMIFAELGFNLARLRDIKSFE